jgi:hypothetical protein
MYELVDLWAEGLDTSYTSFLQMCFKNIAEWEQDENGGYWKFSALTDVATIGESFDEAKAAAEKLRDEKLAHAKQAATIAKNVVAMEALRDAQVRGMAMARLSLTKAQDMISKLEDELAELDDEEADLRRTLAGGGLSASEEEAVRRRLNEIEQERIRLKLTILEREEQELLQKLESGSLSAEEADAIKRQLALLAGKEAQLHLAALSAEGAELNRRLVSGTLSPDEQEAIMQRLAAIEQEKIAVQLQALDAHEAELHRLLDSGMLSDEAAAIVREQLAASTQARQQLAKLMRDADEWELHRKLALGALSKAERKRLEGYERERHQALREAMQKDRQNRMNEMLAIVGPGDFLRAGGLKGRSYVGMVNNKGHQHQRKRQQQEVSQNASRSFDEGPLPSLGDGLGDAGDAGDEGKEPPLHASRAAWAVFHCRKRNMLRCERVQHSLWAIEATMALGNAAEPSLLPPIDYHERGLRGGGEGLLPQPAADHDPSPHHVRGPWDRSAGSGLQQLEPRPALNGSHARAHSVSPQHTRRQSSSPSQVRRGRRNSGADGAQHRLSTPSPTQVAAQRAKLRRLRALEKGKRRAV